MRPATAMNLQQPWMTKRHYWQQQRVTKCPYYQVNTYTAVQTCSHAYFANSRLLTPQLGTVNPAVVVVKLGAS